MDRDGESQVFCLPSLSWCSLCLSLGMAEMRGLLLLLLYMSHSSSAGECAAPFPRRSVTGGAWGRVGVGRRVIQESRVALNAQRGTHWARKIIPSPLSWAAGVSDRN